MEPELNPRVQDTWYRESVGSIALTEEESPQSDGWKGRPKLQNMK